MESNWMDELKLGWKIRRTVDIGDLGPCIDPAILDVVEDVTALPFVERTLWCCAGYGPHAKFKVCPTLDGGSRLASNDRQEHALPYIVIKYRQKDSRFHNRM